MLNTQGTLKNMLSWWFHPCLPHPTEFLYFHKHSFILPPRHVVLCTRRWRCEHVHKVLHSPAPTPCSCESSLPQMPLPPTYHSPTQSDRLLQDVVLPLRPIRMYLPISEFPLEQFMYHSYVLIIYLKHNFFCRHICSTQVNAEIPIWKRTPQSHLCSSFHSTLHITPEVSLLNHVCFKTFIFYKY